MIFLYLSIYKSIIFQLNKEKKVKLVNKTDFKAGTNPLLHFHLDRIGQSLLMASLISKVI